MSNVNNMDLEQSEQLNAAPIFITPEQVFKTGCYLKSLPDAPWQEYCQAYKLDPASLTTLPLETGEQVLDCLVSLSTMNIWAGYLLNAGHIWYRYIATLAEERFHLALSLLLCNGGPADFILYLRAVYRMGMPAIPDQEYDALEQLYILAYPNLTFIKEQVQEDDVLSVLVTEAIKMSRISSKSDAPKKISADKLNDSYSSLNAEKSTSIMPVRSYKETYDFLKNAPICDIHWSLKVDGVNTKVLIKENGGGLDVALSRGRAADSWDYTEALRRLFKVQGVNDTRLSGKITGEGVVDVESMPYFRQKYVGKDYKSPKSTAGAMLRAPQSFDEADYKYLRYFVFEYGEYDKKEAFELLESAGMTVPPWFITKAGAVPLDSLDSFKTWLDENVMDVLWKEAQTKGIGSDGVVLQLLSTVESDRADKYSDLNIALKFSHWTEQAYTSRVIDILFEQRRVEMSVVLVVEPVTTRDMNIATRVSVGSPAILVNDGVKVGDMISFTRKSEAINVYEGKCE